MNCKFFQISCECQSISSKALISNFSKQIPSIGKMNFFLFKSDLITEENYSFLSQITSLQASEIKVLVQKICDFNDQAILLYDSQSAIAIVNIDIEA